MPNNTIHSFSERPCVLPTQARHPSHVARADVHHVSAYTRATVAPSGKATTAYTSSLGGIGSNGSREDPHQHVAWIGQSTSAEDLELFLNEGGEPERDQEENQPTITRMFDRQLDELDWNLDEAPFSPSFQDIPVEWSWDTRLSSRPASPIVDLSTSLDLGNPSAATDAPSTESSVDTSVPRTLTSVDSHRPDSGHPSPHSQLHGTPRTGPPLLPASWISPVQVSPSSRYPAPGMPSVGDSSPNVPPLLPKPVSLGDIATMNAESLVSLSRLRALPLLPILPPPSSAARLSVNIPPSYRGQRCKYTPGIYPEPPVITTPFCPSSWRQEYGATTAYPINITDHTKAALLLHGYADRYNTIKGVIKSTNAGSTPLASLLNRQNRNDLDAAVTMCLQGEKRGILQGSERAFLTSIIQFIDAQLIKKILEPIGFTRYTADAVQIYPAETHINASATNKILLRATLSGRDIRPYYVNRTRLSLLPNDTVVIAYCYCELRMENHKDDKGNVANQVPRWIPCDMMLYKTPEVKIVGSTSSVECALPFMTVPPASPAISARLFSEQFPAPRKRTRSIDDASVPNKKVPSTQLSQLQPE